MLRPTTRILAGLAALALLTAACGDDDDADGGSAGTTTEAPPSDDGEGEGDGEDAGACAEAAEAASPEEALTAFPDNPDVTWAVLGTREGGLGTVLVELEPDPDEVGYPSFTFVFSCGDGTPVRLGTYAFEDGQYILLATTDALADTDVELAPVLEG